MKNGNHVALIELYSCHRAIFYATIWHIVVSGGGLNSYTVFYGWFFVVAWLAPKGKITQALKKDLKNYFQPFSHIYCKIKNFTILFQFFFLESVLQNSCRNFNLKFFKSPKHLKTAKRHFWEQSKGYNNSYQKCRVFDDY